MRRLASILLVGFGATLGAQSPDPQRVEFEVVSVKPNISGSTSSRTTTLPGGQFVATNVTTKSLIALGFRMKAFQVTGGPGWLESSRFDVLAKTPDPSQQPLIPEMVRAMLADRFKLVTHVETRDQPVFALVRAGDTLGPQIKPSLLNCSGGDAPRAAGQPSPCGLNTSTGNQGGTMTGGAQSAADLAAALASFATDRHVIDRTGLTGSFDFTLRWTSDAVRVTGNTPGQDFPSIFTAVQEQLGLKLEPARGPVEFLIVDGIQPPTPD